MLDKATLRKQMLAKRQAISSQQRQEINHGLWMSLQQDTIFLQSQAVFFFFAVQDEFATQEMITYCLQQGKTVCIPRCGTAHSMRALAITSLAQLEPAAYGIPAPNKDCTEISPKALDYIVVPCLCADTLGYRLGYGGGFYDRYLAQTNAVTAVLCPKDFLLPMVPHDMYDQRCQKIITESGVLTAYEK